MSGKARWAKAQRRKRAAQGGKLTDFTRYRGENFKKNIKRDVIEILNNGVSDLFDIDVKERKCLHEEGVGLEMIIGSRHVSLYFYPHRSTSAYTTSGMNRTEFLVRNLETYEGLKALVTSAVSAYGLGFVSETVVGKHFQRYVEETGMRLTWKPVTDQLVDINEGYDGIMLVDENIGGRWVRLASVKTDIKYGDAKLYMPGKHKPGIAIFSLSKSFEYKAIREKIKKFIKIARRGQIPRV